MDRAITRSPEFYRLVQLVFEKSQHPEELYRTYDGLLRLQKSALADSFDKACLIAESTVTTLTNLLNVS